ncbi:hypothetical protein QZH41_003167 [Actinostola sp. cb2023]|nr:hypothetical protein QZH41_003167 [Actinostola sp. cb2023]
MRKCKMLDKYTPGRPLVVVFGSCTCPSFMASLRDLDEVVREFIDMADFVMVYIDEAHAEDGWKFKENYKIPQHKTLQQRLVAAHIMQSQKPPAPVFVDTMANTANIAYGAFPERLYIIHGGVITYEGGIGPMNYNVVDVHEWLMRYRVQNHRSRSSGRSSL